MVDELETVPPEATAEAERVDGRRARSLRTRTSVLDAALDLIVELDRIPTVEEVAERAEVSIRSVFRHFATLDDLWTATTERFDSRFRATATEPIDPSGTVDDRLDRLITMRVELFLRAGPIWRVALRDGGFEPDDPGAVGRRRRARDQVAELFAEDLAPLDPHERERAADAAATVSNFLHWEQLALLGHGLEETAEIMRRQVRGALLIDA